MSLPQQRPVELLLGGQCALTCSAFCDCANDPADSKRIAQALSAGGSRLTLRGAAVGHSHLDDYVSRARASGFGEVVVRTDALPFQAPADAQAFRRRGIDGVIVPLFSHDPRVHDRVTGRAGSLVQALVAMRSLSGAGLTVEVEVALLPGKYQDLAAVVELAHRAVPSVKSIRFLTPRGNVPEALRPSSWKEDGPRLAAALDACKSKGIVALLRTSDGLPFCALASRPELLGTFKFNPKVAARRSESLVQPAESCGACAVREHCPGVTRATADRHGANGLVPFRQKPAELYEQRTTPARKWDDHAREAARNTHLLVLRPTVNCNQDCTFCSANETSNNVWPDHEAMYRQIARAARRGMRRVAFSGGEPTLSKHLTGFIRVASRLGVKEVEIVSNAVLLDRREKVDVLREAGLTHAFVSLHAHDERLSRGLTQKAGDFPKTVQGVKHLVDAGVVTVLNHVISARNYRFIEKYVEFVAREFGPGKVMVSFAFVTPQYKALENLDLVPKLSEAMPYLRRALRKALALGVPFVVGSRQGVPPCFLKEFRGWSDVFDLAHEAASEDAFQKERGEACGTCRYRRQCTGLWKPYVARFGFGELEPVVGEAYTDEEVAEFSRVAHPPPWGAPESFDVVPAMVRDLEAERVGPPAVEEAALAGSVISLPMLDLRTRPVRLAMAGTGNQARRLARSMKQVRGLSLDAVASPHAPDAHLADFGSCPAYRSLPEALDDIRPEGVVIAAATLVHAELTKEAISRGIPVLLEKPVTRTDDEATALLSLLQPGGPFVMPAHNDLFAPGLDAFLSAAPFARASWSRRVRPGSPESLRAWSRAALYELLYHAVSVVHRACGGGVGEVVTVSTRGVSVPEGLRATIRFGANEAEIVLDFTASVDELRVGVGESPVHEWCRSGREVTVSHTGVPMPVQGDGSDTERMLAHFRDAVLGKVAPAVTLAQALEVQQTARRIVEAIEAGGTSLERVNAPKHVASRPEAHARIPG